MKSIYHFLLILCCTITVLPLCGQRKLPSIDYETRPPLIASLARYGEIPIDHSTGVPSIEIPIHVLKMGDIEIPIKITYHSSGIKVRDIASEVGLGFTLNIGASMSATVLGREDHLQLNEHLYPGENEMAAAINNAVTNQQVQSISDYFRQILTGPEVRDHFSDRFQYQLSTGESGVFRFDYVTGEPHFMPYQPIKVDYDEHDVSIVSTNGYRHYFQRAGVEKAYKIKKIVSPNTNDSIMYHYNLNSNIYPWVNADYSVMWKDKHCELVPDQFMGGLRLQCSDIYSSFPQVEVSLSYTDSPLLDSLVSDDEIIHFEYATGRLDDFYPSSSSTLRRLTKITVKDRWTRDIIKVFTFQHSYFGSQQAKNRRMRLDRILIAGSGQSSGGEYEFTYHTTVELPEYPAGNKMSGFNNSVWHEDYWGYYNGALNSHLFPSFFSTFGIPGFSLSANMEPNPIYTKACILTSIKYPTGGNTLFEYEQHRTASSPTPIGGGLRLKKITSYAAPSSPATIKEYLYDDPYADPIVPVDYKWASPQEHWVHYKRASPTFEVFTSNYNSYMAMGKSLLPTGINYGPSVVYGKVTELSGQENDNIGKVVYTYESPDSEESRYPRPTHIEKKYLGYYHSDLGNYVPRLSTKTVYKFEDNLFWKVSEEQNSYERLRTREFNTGISLASTILLESFSDDASTTMAAYNQYNMREYLNSLVFANTKGFEEAVVLKTSISRTFENNVLQTEEITTYDYDANYVQISAINRNNSKGSSLKDEFRYPFNHNAPAYTAMVERNMLTTQTEHLRYSNGQLFESVRTGYGFWGNGSWTTSTSRLILPKQVDVTYSTLGDVREISYNRYNNLGKVVEVVQKQNAPRTYLWSYNGRYVIARIDNATFADVRLALNDVSAPFLELLASKAAPTAADIDRINALRSMASMKNASVTTYTHRPSIGLSSMTDPRGIKEFYEYDGYGRLTLVKDHDGHILRAYCYNYVGQLIDCSSATESFSNVTASRTFRKNNCPSGQQGGLVTYTVPAGRYSSTVSQAAADQLAQNEITTMGQTFANQNGGCTTQSNCTRYRIRIPTSAIQSNGGNMFIGFANCSSGIHQTMSVHNLEAYLDESCADCLVLEVCASNSIPISLHYSQYGGAVVVPDVEIFNIGDCN